MLTLDTDLVCNKSTGAIFLLSCWCYFFAFYCIRGSKNNGTGRSSYHQLKVFQYKPNFSVFYCASMRISPAAFEV